MRLASFFQGALLSVSSCFLSFTDLAASSLSYRVYSSSKSLAEEAAEEIIALVRSNPAALVVLPTGASPLPIYKRLHERFASDSTIDLSNLQIFFWDEYAGLETHHPLRYSVYIEEEFLKPFQKLSSSRAPQRSKINVPFDPLRTNRQGHTHEEREVEAREYETLFQNARKASRHQRADLYLLGAGGAYPVKTDNQTVLHGGHIGFNEPTETWEFKSTNVSTLSLKTRKDTEFRFRSLRELIRIGTFSTTLQTTVPHYAVTLGIQNFLDDSVGPNAARVIAVMTGEAKSPVVQQLIEHGESPHFPVTIIHRSSNAVVMIDEDAAHLLRDRRERIETLSPRYNQRDFFEAFDPKQGQRRVLIISPHPDDDVISMAMGIKRLNDWGHDIRVLTATSGSNAVRLDVPADSLFAQLDEEQRSEWARRIRENESRQALRLLGLNSDRASYLNADFYYRRGIPGVEAFSFMDEIKARDILIRFRPTDIFYAAESDPHGAHGLAFQLVYDAYQKLMGTHYSSEIRFWGYRGAYAEWNFNDTDIYVLPFSEDEMKLKIESIKKHESQINPLFPSFDPREFYERASDRNREAGTKWSAMGRSNLPCAEVFRLMSGKI